MPKVKIVIIVILILVIGWLIFSRQDSDIEPVKMDTSLSFLNLSDEFVIQVFADNLEGPRVIEFDEKNRVVVSETAAGRVVLLDDEDGDGHFDNKVAILENLNRPHGLAFYTHPTSGHKYLYVAETDKVRRYIYDHNAGTVKPIDEPDIANLPADGRHFSRTIAFGPNFRTAPIITGFNVEQNSLDRLYISVGSSCDVCIETTWKRAAILESDPEGKFTAEFAGGLRNTVFFAFNPVTGSIWGTDMGRDNLGDNLPPDEVNLIRVATDEHEFGARRFGWPYCYGSKVKDTAFNPERDERIDIPKDCTETESTLVNLQAHSSPLGIAFVPDSWPANLRNRVLIALHGSWNRSEKVGYKIVSLKINGDTVIEGPDDFVTGWLAPDGDTVKGRPVDLKFGPDDALYVSDDATGVIYKISPRAAN